MAEPVRITSAATRTNPRSRYSASGTVTPETPTAIDAEIQFLERRHADNPDGRFWVPLADRFRRVGRLDRAEELLRAGLEHAPGSVSARVVLAQCLADGGRNSEARREFERVLVADPQNLVALRALGSLAAAEGRRDEALHWYRGLLAVDPSNEDGRRALDALHVAASEPDPEEAEPDAELVTETIAELYTQQGLHGHAAEVYRQLLARGENADLRLRLEAAERRAAETEEERAPEPDASAVTSPPAAFGEPTIGEQLRALLAWPAHPVP